MRRRGPLSRFIGGLSRAVAGVAAIAVAEVVTAYLKGGERLARQVAETASRLDEIQNARNTITALIEDPVKVASLGQSMQNADFAALSDLDKTVEEVAEKKEAKVEYTDGAEWLWPGKLGVVAKESTNVVMFSYTKERGDLHVVFCNEREREAGPGGYPWVYPRYYIYPNVDYRTWYSLKMAPSAGEWFWRNMIEKSAEFVVIWGPTGNGGRLDPTANPTDLLPNLHLGDL